MDTPSEQHQGVEAVELVLAAAGPLSLDELVGWNLVRPNELWSWMKAASRAGAIGEVAEDGGSFEFRDPARQAAALAGCAAEDWPWLVGLEGIVPRILASARHAAGAFRPKVAEHLYRALVLHAAPDAFPGGLEGWLQVVVDSVRAFRFCDWLDEPVLARALTVAEARGDLRAQAILSAARGFHATRVFRVDEARAHLERALAAANAAGDREVSIAVHIQVAYGQVLQGFAHDAIATFERLLGDLPEEILPLPPGLAAPFDPLPEAPLAVLGTTYSQVGQYGRGLELLHQLRLAGLRSKRPELVALAQSFLSGNHAGRRELEPALAHAEPAYEFWAASGTGTGTYFLWHAAISLAWCRMVEGRLEAAREILEVGHRARVASGLMYFGGSALLEVLDRLELESLAPPAGLGIEAEIDRVLSWGDGYMSAVGHRLRARRLARGALDDALAEQIEGHHARSIEILERSRATVSELARAHEDAGGWAARRGRPEEAARHAAQARALFASIQLDGDGAADPSRLARLVVELGQLAALADRTEGAWGEIAARLCAMVGAERCALIEATAAGPSPLAVRGGDKAWIAAVQALAQQRDPCGPEAIAPPADDGGEEPAAAAGALMIVPFGSAKLARRGWAVLENRHSRALVCATDRPVLEVLTAQLGVLFENVVVWQELVSARRRLEQENRYYRSASPPTGPAGRIVGRSPALAEALALVARVAPATTSVLVCGETGVGKELIAREIHRLSPRSRAPFIAVHIASLAPGLVASGLFGHERGAFTGAAEQVRGRFELADGGTLFLDEVGELGLEDQVRLLRVLQEGTFERVGGTRPLSSDFRLVAATNRDLAAAVKAGQFREDLYFRLAAFPIQVPPLRERQEEIPTLALYFMEAIGRKLGFAFDGISEADMARLVAYRWPGNVRELEHVIERAALLSEPPRLSIPPLDDAFAPASAQSGPRAWQTLEQVEKRYLLEVIAHTRGRLSGPDGAAAILGLKPTTLNFRIDKLGLRLDVKRARAQ